MLNLHICHQCDESQSRRDGCAGLKLCACRQSGRDIIDHAEKGDCPLGKFDRPGEAVELGDWVTRGPVLWAKLHRWGMGGDLANAAEWIGAFGDLLGCADCATHWRAWVAANPPDAGDHDRLFAWTVAGHNAANRRLGKAEVSIEAARERWNAGAVKG